MPTKKLETKTHLVSMTMEEMIFALFAFRRAHAHEHFMAVRMRLKNALLDMGLDSYGEEFDEATKKHEYLFRTVLEAFNYMDTI